MDDPLVTVGRELRARGYHFTTVTPETHRRVNARAGPGRSLADVFGWSRPFVPDVLSTVIRDALVAADAVERGPDGWRSRVRFSTLGDDLFCHSAFPTIAADAVFFGPDTYRFVAWLRRVCPRDVGRLVDVGCGSGAGALALRDRARELVLADVNPAALRLAAVNAALGGRDVTLAVSDVLDAVDGPVDLVIANPPYLVDDAQRAYRHGGDGLGTALAARIVRESLPRLSPGGRVLLYTGTPIVEGRPVLDLGDARATWEELDPDVFGEELDRPVYAGVDRLAAVGIVIEARPGIRRRA